LAGNFLPGLFYGGENLAGDRAKISSSIGTGFFRFRLRHLPAGDLLRQRHDYVGIVQPDLVIPPPFMKMLPFRHRDQSGIAGGLKLRQRNAQFFRRIFFVEQRRQPRIPPPLLFLALLRNMPALLRGEPPARFRILPLGAGTDAAAVFVHQPFVCGFIFGGYAAEKARAGKEDKPLLVAAAGTNIGHYDFRLIYLFLYRRSCR